MALLAARPDQPRQCGQAAGCLDVSHRDSRRKPATTIECNPLVVNGVMYLTTAQLKLCALEADTGKLLWQFDPFEGVDEDMPRGVNRGVAYWEDGNDQRIFFVARARLCAFDAKTGKLIPDFGQGGSVDLNRGLGRDISRLDLRRHLARHHLQEPDHSRIAVRRRPGTRCARPHSRLRRSHRRDGLDLSHPSPPRRVRQRRVARRFLAHHRRRQRLGWNDAG